MPDQFIKTTLESLDRFSIENRQVVAVGLIINILSLVDDPAFVLDCVDEVMKDKVDIQLRLLSN